MIMGRSSNLPGLDHLLRRCSPYIHEDWTTMLLPSQRNRLYWTILLLVIVGFITTKYPLQTQTSRSIASERRSEIALLLTRNATEDSSITDPADGAWDEVALTKAFGLPEFRSKVFPFFYRHEGDYGEDELTLTVFITPNRFDRLRDLVLGYQGRFRSILHRGSCACTDTLSRSTRTLQAQSPQSSTSPPPQHPSSQPSPP